MAGKPKPMSQIKQLLRLHQSGWKIKAIARELGLSKNTVKAYLKKVQAGDWTINSLLELDAPVLEAKFHAGNPAYKDPRYQALKNKLDYYAKELNKTGVTKFLLWEEYRKEHPDGYEHSQFCFHLLQHIRTSRPSMVLNHKPAEKLFIDFAGKKLSHIDSSTGEVIEAEVFVACLPYSDYAFAMAAPSQKVSDFIHVLGCCLQFLGGVPDLIVPDNFKSAVIKANNYEPDINRALEDFADHYGTSVLPTRARKPKDKALVENQVKLIYSRVYAKLRNQQFFSLHALNEAISAKVHSHNQTRMQEKPFSREERFLAEEKPLLKALPQTDFEIKHYKEYTVRMNNHVQLYENKHYYSVPFRYTGKKVKVIYTRSIVRIYHEGEQIAVHARSYQPGGYTTIKDHLSSEHQYYMGRSPDYYLNRAKGVSKTLYELFNKVFGQGRHPEHLYGTCDGILSIYRKVGNQKADKACKIALEYQRYSYNFILNILKNNMVDQDPEDQDKPLPPHSNVRGKNSFM